MAAPAREAFTLNCVFLLNLIWIWLSVAAVFSSQPQAITADTLIGTWSGVATHDGETSPVIVEFTRPPDGDMVAAASLPAIHARLGLGKVRLAAGRVDAGPITFDYDAPAQALIARLPEALVPKYDVQVRLRRSPLPPPAPVRRHLDAPVRQPLWTVDLGAPIWADLALHNGLLIVGADDGKLRALDAATGTVRWTFEADGAFRARPTFAGSDLVIQADGGWLYRLDAATGKERWRTRIASKPARRVPLADPASRYENRASAAAIAGDRIFVGTHEGNLIALGAAIGNPIWTFKTGDSIVASPVVHAGRVYCVSMDHYLYAVDERTGALAWKHDTGEAMTSTVAVFDSTILAGSRSYDLEALSGADGRSVWKKYFWFSWVESSPSVLGRTAYVGSSDAAKVFAIEGSSGRSVWESDVLGSAWAQPVVTESTVYQAVAGVTHYIAPHRGAIVALDRRSGRATWWYPSDEPRLASTAMATSGFAGAVALDSQRVFAGGIDGRVHAFAR